MSKSKNKKRRTLPAHTEPAAPPKTGDPEKTGEDVSRGARWMAAVSWLWYSLANRSRNPSCAGMMPYAVPPRRPNSRMVSR